jgi:hypothetical protein
MRPDYEPPVLWSQRQRRYGPRPWLWFFAGAAAMLAGLAIVGVVR